MSNDPAHTPDRFARFFHVARSGNRPLWNAVKTLTQSALLWSVFFAAIPAVLYVLETHSPLAALRWTHHATIRHCGIVAFCLFGLMNLSTGIGLAVVGRGTPLPLDTAQRLVIWGPYRYLRNPMAFGSIVQGVMVGVAAGSPTIVGYSLLGVFFWQYCVRPSEEADLERRFGEPYRRYRANVRCWIPRLRAYLPEKKSSDG